MTDNNINRLAELLEIADNTPFVDYKEEARWLLANGVILPQWISVNDRLPEENTRVLVWLGVKLYDCTQIDTDRMINEKWVRWGKDVTYWMPLPKAPKEEAEEKLKELKDNA